ncbi:MAG: prepilin-type N-terminal cleavage/methylation domain-containing protein [Gammaproteobacteria bacterium]|nr:prepilin-type N-terminal cleavage/methylation domain-containing protein [Gammaproteobacteria bacterium]
MKRHARPRRGRRLQASASAARARRMRGLSLIEVLVSVVIIAIGLLGIAAMESLALRGSQGSLESSQAVMQTNAILEAMRANRANAANYNMAMTCAVPAGGTLAQNDQRDWITALKTSIGQVGDASTCGQIAGCPDACVVTVRWDDQRAGGAAERQVVTETRI